MKFVLAATVALNMISATCLGADDSQRFAKWQRIEFQFVGPDSKGLGNPNPFSVELDAVFTSPSGKTFRIAGFYDGDGNGGLDGNVWKVRFSADESGRWTYRTTSSEKRLTDHTGQFEVTATASDAEGFWKWGRLQYVGTEENKIRYLNFRDGPYWLKAGCDDPENFLGRYRHFDTTKKRKAAIDYLASKGINSLYDRRRDRHDQTRRSDASVRPPFLEQPWARSKEGTAWDGLPKYDLTKYNDWYFKRLNEFADLCDRKGTVLLHNFYMQHALLETNAHYVDFPWRPENCIQKTEMPDRTPAANAFYDISHETRRKLHEHYIRKCLDVLGDNKNVIYLCSEEYTGPKSFMEFWLKTVFKWEQETGRDVHVALSACKDVLDAMLADGTLRGGIDTIDLRYGWYESSGQLYAPQGGREVAGRYIGQIGRTTPEQIHRQVAEYRAKYPSKAIIHGLAGTRQHAWAALMRGASMMVGQMPYPAKRDPTTYISPQACEAIQPTYEFIREHIANELLNMIPTKRLLVEPKQNWCLSNANHVYLVYLLKGGKVGLNLADASGMFTAQWFDPRSGKLTKANGGQVAAGGVVEFTTPDKSDWALWLSRR